MPGELGEWKPQLTVLYSLAPNVTATARYMKPPISTAQRYDYPFIFEAKLEGRHEAFWLMEASKPSHMAEVYLPTIRRDWCPLPEEHEGRPGVWVLLPIHRQAPETMHRMYDFPRLLHHHHTYHQRLGFAGHLVFASPVLLPVLTASELLRPLLLSGSVRLVLWDDFPHYRMQRLNHISFDQRIFQNVAILALQTCRGGMRLGAFDVDEYLHTPGSSTLQELWPRCFAKEGTTVHFRARIMYPSQGSNSTGPEYELWTKQPPGCHPLCRYDRMDGAYSRGKSFPMARSFTYGTWLYGVHDAVGGKVAVAAEERCGVLLHAKNMFRSRLEPGQTLRLERSDAVGSCAACGNGAAFT